ncbi:phosphinothricin N-acetyltransferase [Aspergillus lentulus]|uniref:GNAT family N-acetyltransferase n=1 Tax=Aspergillus lentulus TaxID=293939 RepID=UPI001395BF96|nr:phosphinothricin N-acetyltransferase [Aspergillus lentulus]GFF48806.1 phosphinothricin N-acetyltransferase [Aspergillus lentulus]
MSIQIREATQDDLPQIHTIYSFYVRESVATFLRHPPPLESLISSFRDIQSRGLPYRVAINNTTGKVLGYGYLAPFNGTRMSYAPTVEVSLYVHPEYTSKGVGRRLLSSILESAESEAGVWHRAREHEDYETHVQVIPEDEGRVRSIIACMSVDTTGRENGEGLRRWYEQRGFVERGRLPNVGYKQGRWIDTIYLQYSVCRDNF